MRGHVSLKNAEGGYSHERKGCLTPETAMYDQSAVSFCARSGQNRSGRSLTSCCLLFYSFINSGRTAKHAA